MRIIDCIHWLWHTSRGFRIPIAICGAMGLLLVGTSLAFVWITKRLVDTATSPESQSLLPYVALMIGCMVLQIIVRAIYSRVIARCNVQMKSALQQQLFVKTMHSSWTGKEKHHTGDVLNRMGEDVRLVAETICTAVPTTLVTIVQLLAAFSFLLLLEPKLAWSLFFVMPAALLLSRIYMRRMRTLTQDVRQTESQVQSHIQEHLQHRTLIETMEQTHRSESKLSDLQKTMVSQVMRRTDFSLFSRTAIHFGFASGYAITFLWGVYGLQNGTVTFGLMTAFLQLVMQVQQPIVELSRQLPSFVHSFTSSERLSELQTLPQEEQGEAIALPGTIGIRLHDVTFTYPDGASPILTHFSHDFQPGTLTAIVGETGAGKSTLIRLLLALLHPLSGTITFYSPGGEHPASPLTRCNLVYVPQGNTLMSGTIRENLLLGNPLATDAELTTALHIAVADFVFDLPHGLDTSCGEGGMGLSEGQAQRIAIARGLLRPGGVLLLDEPSSALDGQTQQTLMQRLRTVAQGKTVIIITHRDDIGLWVDETLKLERKK